MSEYETAVPVGRGWRSPQDSFVKDEAPGAIPAVDPWLGIEAQLLKLRNIAAVRQSAVPGEKIEAVLAEAVAKLAAVRS